MDTQTRSTRGPRRATFVDGSLENHHGGHVVGERAARRRAAAAGREPESEVTAPGPVSAFASTVGARLRRLSRQTWVSLAGVGFLLTVMTVSIIAVAGSKVAPVEASTTAADAAASTTGEESNSGSGPDVATDVPVELAAPVETAAPGDVVAPAVRYYRAGWSDDVHQVDAAGVATRVSMEDWQAAGSPTVEIAPTRYVMTPWSTRIFGVVTWPVAPSGASAGEEGPSLGVPLTADQYVSAGSPAIEQVMRIPGDAIVQFTGETAIFHVVGDEVTPLTAEQWASLGSPTPTVQAPASPTYIRGILLVNKSFPLPSTFGDGLTPETTAAFEAMRGAASSSNLSLRIVSGFRSYSSQDALYSRYVRSQGQAEADRFSARPGYSEHQTGLTVDINQTTEAFADTAEGRWVAENAHLFGFIVRYPDGKEAITGYTYEPWHVRYVGVDVATHLKTTGLTLDEYLGVSSQY